MSELERSAKPRGAALACDEHCERRQGREAGERGERGQERDPAQ
jgi:hypothetical protein